MVEMDELKAQLDSIESKVDEIIAFCKAVSLAVNGVAQGGGMGGMMARQMIPPETLEALSHHVSNGVSLS